MQSLINSWAGLQHSTSNYNIHRSPHSCRLQDLLYSTQLCHWCAHNKMLSCGLHRQTKGWDGFVYTMLLPVESGTQILVIVAVCWWLSGTPTTKVSYKMIEQALYAGKPLPVEMRHPAIVITSASWWFIWSQNKTLYPSTLIYTRTKASYEIVYVWTKFELAIHCL